MAPPRVRFATRLFTPEVAAAAFRERQLADALVRAGVAVNVLTTTPPSQAGPVDDGDLVVRRLPALRDANGNIRGYVQYLSFDLPLLIRAMFRGRPDAWIVEPPPTTGGVIRLVAALQRRPYIWYAADIWSDAAGSAGAPRLLVEALRRVEVHVMRRALRVLSISDAVTERLTELGVDGGRVVTVGNGVDTTVFTPHGPRHVAEVPYFVYAGTMSEWQGAGVFVEAIAEVRARGGQHRVLFLGQGSELPALREQAERLAPGAVDFLGVLPPAVCAEYLRGATAALVSIRPGLGYDFAVPTKIYAATASGTPVIFAGKGAGAEVVAGAGLGLGVDHRPEAVAEAMETLAEMPRDDAADQRRADWTRRHASLAARADGAARAILEALAERQR